MIATTSLVSALSWFGLACTAALTFAITTSLVLGLLASAGEKRTARLGLARLREVVSESRSLLIFYLGSSTQSERFDGFLVAAYINHPNARANLRAAFPRFESILADHSRLEQQRRDRPQDEIDRTESSNIRLASRVEGSLRDVCELLGNVRISAIEWVYDAEIGPKLDRLLDELEELDRDERERKPRDISRRAHIAMERGALPTSSEAIAVVRFHDRLVRQLEEHPDLRGDTANSS